MASTVPGLLTLPPELRLHIYDYIITDYDPCPPISLCCNSHWCTSVRPHRRELKSTCLLHFLHNLTGLLGAHPLLREEYLHHFINHLSSEMRCLKRKMAHLKKIRRRPCYSRDCYWRAYIPAHERPLWLETLDTRYRRHRARVLNELLYFLWMSRKDLWAGTHIAAMWVNGGLLNKEEYPLATWSVGTSSRLGIAGCA